MSSDLLYWVWLAERLGPGSRKLPGLLLRFDSAYDIYRASDEEIMGFDLDGSEKLYRLSDKNLESAYAVVEYCSKNHIDIVPYGAPGYPERLRKLQDPPAVLYVRGKMPELDRVVCIAVVGTRKMSEYGKLSAYKIAYELTAAGALVVSGMALGSDAMAAVGALSASGKTVAVLGCGVDRAYPASHKRLMEKIIDNGCVISEFPPFSEPKAHHFPLRNRIISGLCNGTLVVEADEMSGALITARDAIIQGRDIFSVPGNINSPGSKGTNALILDGAQPVRSAEDVLENYKELYSASLSLSNLQAAKRKSDYNPARARHFGLSYIVEEEKLEKKEKKKEAMQVQKCAPSNAEKEDKKETKVQEDRRAVESLDDKARAVYEAIKEGCEVRLEGLLSTGLSTAQIMAALTVLEIKGLIEQRPGGAYVRK